MLDICPPLDDEPWPTLGPEVCDWIEAHCIYGPGEKAGEPYVVEPAFRAQLYRAYEVYPKDHKLAGRRRFNQFSVEERKGTAKTEKAMMVALVESHPEGPVRCDGFRKRGKLWEPVGVPVKHPYIPLVSYTLEQTEDLGYLVLKYIIEEGPLCNDYDVSLERCIVLSERGGDAGRIVPLSGSPNARDGARTTFQHFDEPHRMVGKKLLDAYKTMRENAYKRVGADAWTYTTSTAGEPGQLSVQEAIKNYGEAVMQGKVKDPRLSYIRRYASTDMPMETEDEVRAALLEATGPYKWSGDIDGLVAHWFEPEIDRQYYRRVWLCQWVAGQSAAYDIEQWKSLKAPRAMNKDEFITLGFDGSLTQDSTALVAVSIEDGHIWKLGIWERPMANAEEWAIPWHEVDELVDETFKNYDVWRLYGDPYRWREPMDRWSNKYGEKRVVPWNTTRVRAMAHACRNLHRAIVGAKLSHDGDPRLDWHMGNARRRVHQGMFNDDDTPMWSITKDRPVDLIDGAVATVLGWEARSDAIKAQAKPSRRKRKMYTFS